jgi:DNA-directed RNA polymerase subunit RPC12/RpoP
MLKRPKLLLCPDCGLIFATPYKGKKKKCPRCGSRKEKGRVHNPKGQSVA